MSILSTLTGNGLVSAGTKLVSGIASLFGQKSEASKARDWQEKMYALQRDDIRDYNDPSAQMSRLKAAGLNPDMMIGNGQLTQLPTGSVPVSPSVPDVASAMSHIGDSVTQGLQAALLESQKENIDADTRKKNADAGLSEIEHNIMDTISRVSGYNGAYEMDDETLKKWNTPLVQARVQQLEKAFEDNKHAHHLANTAGYEETLKELERNFANKTFQGKLREFANKLHISDQEAKEYITFQLLQKTALATDNRIKQYEAEFSNPDFIKALPDGIPELIQLLKMLPNIKIPISHGKAKKGKNE